MWTTISIFSSNDGWVPDESELAELVVLIGAPAATVCCKDDRMRDTRPPDVLGADELPRHLSRLRAAGEERVFVSFFEHRSRLSDRIYEWSPAEDPVFAAGHISLWYGPAVEFDDGNGRMIGAPRFHMQFGGDGSPERSYEHVERFVSDCVSEIKSFVERHSGGCCRTDVTSA